MKQFYSYSKHDHTELVPKHSWDWCSETQAKFFNTIQQEMKDKGLSTEKQIYVNTNFAYQN